MSGLIISSCNGLLCCLGYNKIKGRCCHYVVNPTTKQFTLLPEPHLNSDLDGHSDLDGMNLAFDPSRSPFYKVVNVWYDGLVPSAESDADDTVDQIEMYSSDARFWRVSGEPFTVDVCTCNIGFTDGVFWNGALHWFPGYGDGFYFDVEHERLGRIPALPVGRVWAWFNRSLMHPSATRGHLHVLDICQSTGSQINVYEMKENYSGWFVKYHINLDQVAAVFPSMRQLLGSRRQPEAYSVLSLIREEKEEESFVVLCVPTKIIRLNLVDKSVKIIHDMDVNETSQKYFSAFHYVESYCKV